MLGRLARQRTQLGRAPLRRLCTADASRLVQRGLSHVIGDTSEPLSSLTVDAMFRAAVDANPSRDALLCPAQGLRLTYAELEEEVTRATTGLHHLGLSKGDRLAAWLPNVPEYVVLQYASARLGVILVTVNPAYRLPELRHALNLVGAKALALIPSLSSSDYIEMARALIDDASVPSLEHVLVRAGDVDIELRAAAALGGMGASYKDVISASRKRPSLSAPLPSTHQHEVINIQFTSGTTGLPKAVALTHRSLVNNGKFCARGQRLTSSDRVGVPVPMYHCFGIVIGSLACVNVGATLCFPSPTFDAAATLRAVQDEQLTALYGVRRDPSTTMLMTTTTTTTITPTIVLRIYGMQVPTMFIAELALPDFSSYDLSSLRTGVMAGSICPVETMRQARSRHATSACDLGARCSARDHLACR